MSNNPSSSTQREPLHKNQMIEMLLQTDPEYLQQLLLSDLNPIKHDPKYIFDVQERLFEILRKKDGQPSLTPQKTPSPPPSHPIPIFTKYPTGSILQMTIDGTPTTIIEGNPPISTPSSNPTHIVDSLSPPPSQPISQIEVPPPSVPNFPTQKTFIPTPQFLEVVESPPTSKSQESIDARLA